MDLIDTAIKQGQTALSEFESKQVLKDADIPVTKEVLVQSPDEAVAACEDIGFPVVLKACSWQLMHKSESGGIELGLENADAVINAFNRIKKKVEVPLDGILVQEMIKGQRELVVGLNRDPQFGACVMLGLGGVITEVIKDIVFRVAPFDKLEALDMINELKSRALLDAFRGQQPADLDAVCQLLMAVGNLGLNENKIAEIDINPVIILPDGSIKAVDALIILEQKKRS